MKSTERKRYRPSPALMVISGLIIVAIVLAAVLVGKEPGSIPTDPTRHESTESAAEPQSSSELVDPDLMAGKPVVADGPQQSGAEAVPPDGPSPRTSGPGPDDFPTAVEFFAHVATMHNLDDSEIASELRAWEHLCSKTRTPNGKLYPGYDTAEARTVVEKFEAFCSDIGPAAELAGAESLGGNIDTILSETPPTSRFDDLEMLPPDRALDLLFDDLETALERFSTTGAQVAVMHLLSIDRYPGVEPHGVNSEFNLLRLAFPTAFALVCRRLGDCRGFNHPFVIAYCLETTSSSNRLCAQPGRIGEAIYQTLTPVEHRQYLALLDWINVALARRWAKKA